MKKYIRTEDGVYEYGTNHPQSPHYCVLNYDGTKLLTKEGLGEYPVEEHKIIKQADTIEELCDNFVAFKSCKDYGILEADDYITGSKWEMEDYYSNGYQVHGAIWTDKGLVYVAKMNKEGELELL